MNRGSLQVVRLFVSAVVASLTVAGSGCRKPLHSKPAAQIGDPATAGTLTFNVVEAHWRSQLDAAPLPRIPERNFLLVRVTVTNGGASEAAIPFLKVENGNGETFAESDNGSGVDKWLGLIRRTGPAQTDDGWLLFDVPTNSYKLRVSDGGIEDEHVAYINLPLNMQTDAAPPRVQ